MIAALAPGAGADSSLAQSDLDRMLAAGVLDETRLVPAA
jgi:hypothetical protein